MFKIEQIKKDGPSVGRLFLLTAILLCLTVGCATVGHEFAVEEVDKIEIGETTRANIKSMFGEPWRTGLEDGQLTWTYADYHYSLFGSTSTTDLILRFNQQSIVVSYTYNTTETRESTGSP